MKYRNTETGVVLEPLSPEAEAALSKDERYEAVAGKGPRKPKPENKTDDHVCERGRVYGAKS